jgi:cytochrome c-type biogenesis protein
VRVIGELGLAFLAGIVSFVSPCCLPMVPMYLSYLAGIAGGTSQPVIAPGPAGAMVWQRAAPARGLVLLHALGFVAGFALVFIALGASASVLGQFLRSNLLAVRHISGIVIVLLGLHTAGLLPIRWLYREWRPQVQPSGEGGLLRSAVLGLAFGAGWTPCIGPTLGSILLLGATTTTLGQGVLLLLA